ncbi:hypothetical protein ACLOJK_027402 [Asimina triloba]
MRMICEARLCASVDGDNVVNVVDLLVDDSKWGSDDSHFQHHRQALPQYSLTQAWKTESNVKNATDETNVHVNPPAFLHVDVLVALSESAQRAMEVEEVGATTELIVTSAN